MRQVIAMMLIRLQRKSARAEIQETCLTDPAHAAVRACAPRGIFCKGFAPWAHDRSIAGAPRGDTKSLDLAEFMRILWLCMISARARGQEFCKHFVENHLIFLGFYVEMLANTLCLV